MKKKLAISLAALLVLTVLTACGASTENSAPAMEHAVADSVAAAEENGLGYGGEAQAVRESAGNVKRIYTADLNLETTAFDDAAAGLSKLVEDCGGGWMESSSVNYGGDRYRHGSYSVRVPQENFQVFLDQVGTLCHVVYRSTDTEDVTEYYYDTQGRLKTQQTKLERLQTLLAKAESMEDIIALESAISETEQQIESLSGELRHFDAQIDYSRINLSLSEVYQLSNAAQPATTFSSRVGGALSSGWHGFVTFLQSAVVFLAYAWVPVLVLILGLAAFLICRRRYKAAKKVRGISNGATEKNSDDKQA